MGEWERQTTLFVFVAQLASLLQDLTWQRMSTASDVLWISRTIFTVKVLAALTNLAIYVDGRHFVVDAITGRPNCMLRWVEWTVLSYTMTYVVEGVDATESRTPHYAAASQALSTLCGSLLPFVSHMPLLWLTLLCVSFVLFAYIFYRLAHKERRLLELRGQPCANLSGASGYAVHRAEMSVTLYRQCAGTWTSLVLVWVTDAASRLLLPHRCDPTYPDWGFIADCAVDFIAKSL